MLGDDPVARQRLGYRRVSGIVKRNSRLGNLVDAQHGLNDSQALFHHRTANASAQPSAAPLAITAARCQGGGESSTRGVIGWSSQS